MSKLSEIYCECQGFNLFRPTFPCGRSLSFYPCLVCLSFPITSVFPKSPSQWKKAQNKLSGFLSPFLGCSRSTWKVIIVFHLACCWCSSAPANCDWAAKHQHQNWPFLLCHFTGNWKGKWMRYLLCMGPLLHPRASADVNFDYFLK